MGREGHATATLTTWLLHGHYMVTTWLLHGYYMITTRLLHGHYMIPPRWRLAGGMPPTGWRGAVCGNLLEQSWRRAGGLLSLSRMNQGACAAVALDAVQPHPR